MRVVVTAKAKADLLAIGSFIEAHNPELAVSYTQELLDRCEALADNTPRAYLLVARYERFGIRRGVHGNYLIFYRLQQELIEVIHILQGVRDMEALLFRSPN